jgi:transposase-like protein
MKLARPTGKRDENEIKEAIQSFLDGEKTEAIADKHGVTQPTISYWLHKHGKRLFGDKFKLRKPGRPPMAKPSRRDKEILSMRADGRTMSYIAGEFGITRSRVSKIIETWKGRGC